jgi:hypothetical protein
MVHLRVSNLLERKWRIHVSIKGRKAMIDYFRNACHIPSQAISYIKVFKRNQRNFRTYRELPVITGH